MGKFLFIGMILLLGLIANMVTDARINANNLFNCSYFSLFLLYDLQRIVNGGETNYVSATLVVI